MSPIRALFVFVFLVSPIGTANAADELENFLLQLLVTKNYPYHLINEEYHAYHRSGEHYISVDRNELKEMSEETFKLVEHSEVKNFRILSRADSETFTSVTYELDWIVRMGKSITNSPLSVHTILEKTENGWTVLFDAVTQ